MAKAKRDSSQLKDSLLRRYLQLVEMRHKAVDHSIELTIERDEIASKVKHLSELLKDQRDLNHKQMDVIHELEEALEAEKDRYQVLDQGHQTLLEFNHVLEKRCESHELAIDSIQSAYDAEKLRYEELLQSHEALSCSFKIQSKQFEESNKALIEHQNLYSQIKISFEELKRSHDDLIQYTKVLEGNQLDLESNLEKVQQFLLEKERVCGEQAKAVDDYRLELERHKGLLSKLEQEHQKLAGFVDKQNALIDNQSKEHQKLVHYVTEVEQIRDHITLEHQKLVEYIGILEAEKGELQKELSRAQSERDKVSGELRAIQSKWVYQLYKKTKAILVSSN